MGHIQDAGWNYVHVRLAQAGSLSVSLCNPGVGRSWFLAPWGFSIWWLDSFPELEGSTPTSVPFRPDRKMTSIAPTDF